MTRRTPRTVIGPGQSGEDVQAELDAFARFVSVE
jgi:hypothetical protein